MGPIMNPRFSPRGLVITLVALAGAMFIMVMLVSSSVDANNRSVKTATVTTQDSPVTASEGAGGAPIESGTTITNDAGIMTEDKEKADSFQSRFGSLLSWRPPAWSATDDDEAEAEEQDTNPESGMPLQCSDPYRQPGYLHIPDDNLDVQWIPYFETDFIDIPDPDSAIYPTDKAPTFTDVEPPSDIINRSPHKWHKDLINYVKTLQAIENQTSDSLPLELNDEQKDLVRRVNWAHNRRVLVLGDSIDRYMVKFFCSDLGEQAHVTNHSEYGGDHTTMACHIPLLNFTMYHWHVASLYTYRPEWFWLPHVKYVAFEERFEKIFKPVWNEIVGMNGQSPDLILFQSGLWDERVFREAGRFEDGDDKLSEPERKKKYDSLSKVGLGRGGRQLVWDELVFFKSRMDKFVTFVRDMFGADVPLLYRSLSARRESAAMDLAGINMDRVTRALVAKRGIEIFEWSRMAAAFSTQYLDYMHIDHGPLSYTWANMLMYYLFRAAGGAEYNGTLARFPDPVQQYVLDGEAVIGAPQIQVKRNPDTSVDKFWAECHQYNIHWGGR
ncbi:hypothetical protein V1508DRAFT_42280 [Lipomyces doorenjongii]|uniref:uncharacterized protein n=1 Tax=Lipomyces doorenjongii TaxID=383834 RepID=UPI0034CFBE06